MKKALVIFLMLSIWSGPAWAYFTYEKGKDASLNSAGFLSSGKDVPLDIAIMMIVPEGWSVDAPNDFAYPAVSWGGEPDWLTALAEVTAESGCEPRVDEQGKKVALLCEAPPASESIAQDAVKESDLPEPAPVAVTAYVEPVQELPLFTLSSGSLRAQIEAAAQQAGYALHWEYDKDIIILEGTDRTIEIRASFEDFIKVLSMQCEREGHRIQFDIWRYQNTKSVVVGGV